MAKNKFNDVDFHNLYDLDMERAMKRQIGQTDKRNKGAKMKALKLALAATLALSLANADGKAKEFKFSGAKTGALLAKCSKNDAAACYEMAMRY